MIQTGVDKMQVKFVSKSKSLPSYATKGSSAMDIRAYIDEPIIIKPLERMLIPTGLFMELPEGYEAQVRARSGLSIKQGLTMVNGIGTVDSDYRGELMVPVINLGQEEVEIKNGDRIAQMVICRYEQVTPVLVDTLSETERGDGGFGHTGVK